jgi:DNA-binding beta-propeller fold protein YncE
MNMVFASQNKILAVQAQNGLMVLDVSTRKRIFYRTGGCGYSKVALSSDGNILAFEQFGTYTCDHGTKVLLWNLAADRMITSINIYDGAVAEMTLSTDGRMLATVDSRDTVRLREVATGRRYRGIPIGTLSGLTFSPDGSLLATAGGDGTVRLWDVATQQQVGLSMDASTAEGANAVAFTPDGSLLATAGGDGTVRLWDVATQQQIGPSIKAGGVSALAFSPDATLLTTLGPNHAVRQWDVTFPSRLPNAMCSIAGHSLTPSEWKVHIPSEPYRRLCS